MVTASRSPDALRRIPRKLHNTAAITRRKLAGGEESVGCGGGGDEVNGIAEVLQKIIARHTPTGASSVGAFTYLGLQRESLGHPRRTR